MTDPATPPALAIALAYHQAWTSHNLDQAIGPVSNRDCGCWRAAARIAAL